MWILTDTGCGFLFAAAATFLTASAFVEALVSGTVRPLLWPAQPSRFLTTSMRFISTPWLNLLSCSRYGTASSSAQGAPPRRGRSGSVQQHRDSFKLPRVLLRRALQRMEASRAATPVEPPVRLDRPLLTAAQVAELIAVPVSSVYEYARRYEDPLPSVQIGRHRRFDRESLAAWLTRQRATRP
ncbi:MAG: helix-turn-helix domain-containing protein [Thermoleophilaceae bacterium]